MTNSLNSLFYAAGLIDHVSDPSGEIKSLLVMFYSSLPLKDWPSSDTQAASSLLWESAGHSPGCPRITSGLALSGKPPPRLHNRSNTMSADCKSSNHHALGPSAERLTLSDDYCVIARSTNPGTDWCHNLCLFNRRPDGCTHPIFRMVWIFNLCAQLNLFVSLYFF